MKKDEEFFRDCIDQFNESQKKGKKTEVFSPLLDGAECGENTVMWVENKSHLPFVILTILSLLYLNSIEFAAGLAMYREIGDFVLPDFSRNLTMGSVQLGYIRHGITAFRANGMVDNILLLGFFMTRFLFLLESEIRGERKIAKEHYAGVFVCLLFLHIFSTLTNLAEKFQLPLGVSSLESLVFFERTVFLLGFPFFLFGLACLLYYMMREESFLLSPWYCSEKKGLFYYLDCILYCVCVRVVGLGLLHLLAFLF